MTNPSTNNSTTMNSSASAAAERPKGRTEEEWAELPEAARGVLELFSGAMAKIAFPDVDGAVLQQHAERVLERRHNLETARIELEAATISLQRGVEELTSLASRGLAYARIYAAAHPELEELAAELARIDVRGGRGRSSAMEIEGAAPTGKRGRPRKQPRPELPFGAEGEASEVAAQERAGNERNEAEAVAEVVAAVEDPAHLTSVEPASVPEPIEAPAAPVAARGRRGARNKPALELVEPVLERD